LPYGKGIFIGRLKRARFTTVEELPEECDFDHMTYFTLCPLMFLGTFMLLAKADVAVAKRTDIAIIKRRFT